MKTYALLIGVLVAEFSWSYCASRVTPHLVKGEVWKAMVYDASALIIGYEILAVLAQEDYSQQFIMAAVIGGVLGTGLVANQEKKSKKKTSVKATQTQGLTTQSVAFEAENRNVTP